MRVRFLSTVAAAASLLAACSGSPTDAGAGDACPTGAVCVTGTVRYYDFEGGFWAVRGDDSTTYDPRDGLPADYRTDGLRVHLTARVRTDLVGTHQAGPIVDVLALRKL